MSHEGNVMNYLHGNVTHMGVGVADIALVSELRLYLPPCSLPSLHTHQTVCFVGSFFPQPLLYLGLP